MIFKKMREKIHQKVLNQEPGLYLALIFPVAVTFSLTFAGSRFLSHFVPQFYLEWSPGLRVHHFTYGFFVLAAAGYLALIFNGPRAKYLIALLFGFGLGMAFDEFGMWLRLRDDDPVRWSFDGFNIIASSLFVIFSAQPGVKLLKKLWPFRKRN